MSLFYKIRYVDYLPSFIFPSFGFYAKICSIIRPNEWFLLNMWFIHMTPEHPQLGHHPIVVR